MLPVIRLEIVRLIWNFGKLAFVTLSLITSRNVNTIVREGYLNLIFMLLSEAKTLRKFA